MASAKTAKGTKQVTELMYQYNEEAFQKFDTEALDQCKHCQRTFLPSALKHHAKVCKPGKPLKMRAGVLNPRAKKLNQDLLTKQKFKSPVVPPPEEESKDSFTCRYCHVALKQGKIFEHEANCV